MSFTWIAALAALACAASAAAQSSYSVAATDRPSSALLAADEAAWKPASAVTWGPAPYQTTFRALWSREGLFLRFDASDDRPWHTMTKRDDRLWEEEVVEIFIDADRSGRDYLELEISPANVVCDLRMILPWPDMKQDFPWDIEGLETRVVPRPGAKEGAGDWTATAFLPWPAFRTLPSAAAAGVPPDPGDRWRFNLFRIKRPGGPSAPRRDAVFAAWSPSGKPSFHAPEAFRDMVFEAPATPGGGSR